MAAPVTPKVGATRTMNADDLITQWISRLKAGDASAAERLWEAYFQRLVALARMKLGPGFRRMADEEDVALSVFKSLCLGAARGRFPRLHDRDSLWPLLAVLTAHKTQDLVKYQQRRKRGGDRHGWSISTDTTPLEDLFSREPTPEFSAMVAENCTLLMGRLEPPLARIAQWKLDGYSNAEIAQELGCGLRTVERRLELIRRVWEQKG